VGSGTQNRATSKFAVVCGGREDTASGIYSFVGSGYGNIASNSYAGLVGGVGNNSAGYASFLGGGQDNSAERDYSVINGGRDNYTNGAYSVVLGGSYDTLSANASHSMAFGRNVFVDDSLRIMFYDGSNSGRFGVNRDETDGGLSYPIHVGTNTGNGNGAYLTAGGTWTNGSSRMFKERFEQLDGGEVLDLIETLPAQSWEYAGTGERHIWPCAEDFHRAFDVGALNEDGVRDTMYLAAGDVAGVALVGVKELYRMTRQLQQTTEQLHARTMEIEELRAEMAQMQALIEVILAKQKVSGDDTDHLAGAETSEGRAGK
jgi:hypothetical protein